MKLFNIFAHVKTSVRSGRGFIRTLSAISLVLALLFPFVTVPAQAAPDTIPAVELQTVNINMADASTLAAVLSGVGQAKAQDIVRYRETFGPFKTIDELTDVKGIGQSTLDKNRKIIVLE
ncbi:MAG: ComEA family DNA-binding protein [Parahaliea sp.]